MKTIIIFDSLYGHTQAIAEAIGQGMTNGVKVINVKDVDPAELKGVGLLIVGSPTHGGRPSKRTQTFLKNIPDGSLKNVHVAAFDTEISMEGQNFFLQKIIGLLGYAGKHILKDLEQKGGIVTVGPEGFVVKDKEGPLKPGELERATRWAEEVTRKIIEVSG